MASIDEFTVLRRRVLRRCVYALNALALRDDRVPRDGAFDAAVANALAAIIASQGSGQEFQKTHANRVKSPLELLELARDRAQEDDHSASQVDYTTLKEGIKTAMAFRHGRADEEWDALSEHHIKALLALDEHPALRVLELVDGMHYEDAVMEIYSHEAEKFMPFDPKERSMVPDPAYCDNCGRVTLIAEDSHWSGIGEGICIACGEERTYDDTVADHLALKLGEPD